MADSHFQFSFMRLKSNHCWLFLPLVVLLVYWQLPLTFWQQDEWHHLGQEYLWHQGGVFSFLAKDSISPFGLRFLPLAHLANYFQFSLFGSNPVGYSMVSFLMHVFNVVLVYFLSLKIFKQRTIALISGILFASSPLHTQAVSWLIQHTTTLPALTFSLVSAIFFVKYLDNQHKKNLTLALLASVVAISFKETAFFLFPLLLSFLFLYPHSKRVKAWLWLVGLLVIIPLVYFTIFIFLFMRHPVIGAGNTITRQEVISSLPKRFISVPVRVVVQSFVSPRLISDLSRIYYSSPLFSGEVYAPGSPQRDIYLEDIIGKRVMAVIFIVMVLFWVLFFRLAGQKVLLIPVGLLLFSSLPLLFINGIVKAFVFIEPRYLYIPLVGSSILSALVLEKFLSSKKIFLWAAVIVVLFFNTKVIWGDLGEKVKLGNLRRWILTQIKTSYPKLPGKVVIFTLADKSYYGLSETEKILPFQSGLGQTLLVWYYPDEKFPLEFSKNDFLWGITSQGYQEYGDRGFGYFRDFGLLVKTVNKYHLPIESVIAFSYDSGTDTLQDISWDIRQRLKRYAQ